MHRLHVHVFMLHPNRWIKIDLTISYVISGGVKGLVPVHLEMGVATSSHVRKITSEAAAPSSISSCRDGNADLQCS